MNTADKIIERYLDFSGERSYEDFFSFHEDVLKEMGKHKYGTRENVCLEYIRKKLIKGMSLCLAGNGYIFVIMEDTIEDIERGYDKSQDDELRGPKKRKVYKRKKSKDLGKLVDHGEEIPGGNADRYWGREGVDIVFNPDDEKVRIGEKIPSAYKYADVRFIEKHYGLKAIEFGNWLSQQDRINYLSGFGLALFDLCKLIDFAPKQVSLGGRLVVTFGARGRGKALAHFEPATWLINLTRYGRPKKLAARPSNFRRVNLILQDGGVGSFAHEFAHALDCYAGTFITKADEFQVSGGNDTNAGIKFPSAKKAKVQNLMDAVMNKILWKGKNIQSDYYKRLNKRGVKKYFIRRNEIWARSFEIYVHYKLEKQKYRNVFLNQSKYPERFYLTFSEMKKIEKDIDLLLTEIKRHL